jgi:hypothetical protein
MASLLLRPEILFLLLSLSCSKPERKSPRDQDDGGDATSALVRVGDRVVVESAQASFVEATVVATTRDRVRLQMGPGGELVEQSLSNVYPIGSRAVPTSPSGAATLREGDYGVCRMPDGRWRGCRVESMGPLIKTIDDEATPAELQTGEVLRASAVTELNVRQRFERNAKRRAFRDGAKTAGHPRTPTNWHPALNERVIAERDGSWMGAQIKGMRRGAVRVQWDSDHRLSEMPPGAISPEPPFEFAPTVGVYVLTRPSGGARTWAVMRIEAAGTMTLVLSDEVGERFETNIRDVVPLERGGG